MPKNIFLKDDPKELFIAINEFAIIFLPNQKILSRLATGLNGLCNSKVYAKTVRKNARLRGEISHLLHRFFRLMWCGIIWDCILSESRGKRHDLLMKIQNAILAIFSIKFTSGCKRKRKYLIYFAIALLTETPNYNVAIIHDTSEIDAITKKINVVYKQIKKNEKAPATDYLFKNLAPQKTNLEKTIEKIDKMNSIM